MEINEPVKTIELDPNFKFEVAKMLGGEKLRYCFQCGKCNATCPIRRFGADYKPAQIVRATLLGLRDMVLSSDVIWLCAVCFSCTERCPQGVRLTDVIRAIRNLAVKTGHIHRFYEIQGKAISNFGRIFEAEEQEFINEVRVEMDLPPITPIDTEEIKTILQSIKEREE